MKKRRRVTGLVTFDGEYGPPDIEGALAELRRHGIEAVRMPEKFRPLLLHPHDDFIEVSMAANLSTDDCEKLTAAEKKIIDEFWDEVRAITDRFDGDADSFGPTKPGERRFSIEFGEAANDDDALARKIEKIDTDMMFYVARARAWGRLR